MYEVNVENATLCYPIGGAERRSLKEQVLGTLARRRIVDDERLSRIGTVTALHDLSLHLKDGDRVALFGPNGAGKTTLLKAIGGVYPLESGRIRVVGQIQSLFEIGLGFEPDATGRDNILYRGLVMGLDPAAIRAREAEIIAFADLGDFIDVPIRTYSSGMYVRLAFAISTYLQGEILLLDEFLAAGDSTFQAKAERRMRELVGGAHILLLATHSLRTAEQVCARAILMQKGRIVMDGAPLEVWKDYQQRAAAGGAAAA